MAIQWPLVIFGLLAGCGGALFAFIGISELLGIARKTRFSAAIVSLILLVVGGCASVAHLGQPGNIMAAAANLFSFSGISVELIMLGINVILVIVYMIVVKRENGQSAAKIIGIIGIITGIILTFVVGNGYVIEAQRYWNTFTLPLGYLGSGLAMGGTLFLSLAILRKEETEEIQNLGRFVLVALILQAVFFIAYGIAIGFIGNAILYWGGIIVVGAIIPLICVYLARKNMFLIYIAFGCTIIGGLCFRILMWMLGTGFLDFFSIAAMRGVLGI